MADLDLLPQSVIADPEQLEAWLLAAEPAVVAELVDGGLLAVERLQVGPRPAGRSDEQQRLVEGQIGRLREAAVARRAARAVQEAQDEALGRLVPGVALVPLMAGTEAPEAVLAALGVPEPAEGEPWPVDWSLADGWLYVADVEQEALEAALLAARRES